MVNFDEHSWKRADLGFQGTLTARPYTPVLLKVSFTEALTGSNPLNLWQETVTYGPDDMHETECHVLSARDLNDEYGLFIAGPEDEVAYAYDADMQRIKLVFDAEKFFYVMENASRRNKLNFFKNAVLPSIVEANKFLALVDSSNLSGKDRNRAYAWMQQIVKKQGLKKR